MKGTKKTVCAAAIALALVAGASVGSARAYFTTFATISRSLWESPMISVDIMIL